MLRLALKQSLIHSKPSPFIYFGIDAHIYDFLTIVLTNEVITYDSKKHSVSFFTCTNCNQIK
jgi:hypothetical protein